jgi:hypothetical protein
MGTTNTPDIRTKFGEAPSGSNVTWSMTAYIPILTFFANTAAGANERSKTAATEANAAFIGASMCRSHTMLVAKVNFAGAYANLPTTRNHNL